MKISTLFFDLGKVLVDYDFNIALGRVAARSPLALTRLQDRAYADYPLINDYESGRVTTARFFAAMKEHFRFDGSAAELELIWCDVFTPLDRHIQYARSLAEHYPLAIISNTSDAHIRFLEERHDFFGLFQKRIYSHQVGHMKPSAEIYHLALAEMGGVEEESLLIDDLEANILGAAKLGWQTIHLRPEIDLRAALRGYGLNGI